MPKRFDSILSSLTLSTLLVSVMAGLVIVATLPV